jgi:hypothetical protein
MSIWRVDSLDLLSDYMLGTEVGLSSFMVETRFTF